MQHDNIVTVTQDNYDVSQLFSLLEITVNNDQLS